MASFHQKNLTAQISCRTLLGASPPVILPGKGTGRLAPFRYEIAGLTKSRPYLAQNICTDVTDPGIGFRIVILLADLDSHI